LPTSATTSPAEPAFDKAAVRRDFARAAGSYDRHAGLQRRVAQAVAGRVPPGAARGGTFLDIGCGTGLLGEALVQRGARPETLAALDLAHPMTRTGRYPGQPAVTADVERLPFAAGSLDGVVSSLTLQWVNDLPAALAEMVRVLRPGGLLVASTLLEGTLAELDAAMVRTDGVSGVSRFLPRQAVAEALAGTGLADPMCEVEPQVDHVPDPMTVLRDLKGLGAVNKNPDRRRGLHGRQWLQRLCRHYREAARVPEGPVPATWRVAYLVGRRPL
jgi:malonyl-CoA O-methyltransferase